MDKIDYDKLIGQSGHYLTQALFWEYRHQTGADYTPFTLKERDHSGCISMYRLYMSCETEYEAALKILNSWKHWQILCDAPWFQKELSKWREEREIRELALGKAVLIKNAEEGNVAAAKALIDTSSKRKAGRPSKIEVEEYKKKEAAANSKVSSILERMKDK